MNAGTPRPRRRWLQFSLRSILALTAVVAIWLGIKVTAAHNQRNAVKAILASGGQVYYDFQKNGAK